MSKKAINSNITLYRDKNLIKLQKKLKSLEKKFAQKEDRYRELLSYLKEFENYVKTRLSDKESLIHKLQEELQSLQTSNQSKIDMDEIEELFSRINSQSSSESIDESKPDKSEEEIEADKELKSIYRQASKLIHPDIIREEDREEATQLFQELNHYYSEKNLLKVREIYRQVSKERVFQTVADQKLDSKLLKVEIQKLQEKIDEAEYLIEELEFKVYQAPRDEWATITKEFGEEMDSDIKDLEKEIRKLKRELSGDFRVPKAMKERFDKVVNLTDSVAENLSEFDEEYKFLFRKLTAQVARKRDKPLSSGFPKSWASGVITVVSLYNELDGELLSSAYSFLKVSKATAKNYEKQILAIAGKNLFEYEHSHREVDSFKEMLNAIYDFEEDE